MAHVVVDRLEVVDVDQHQGQGIARPGSLADRVVQALIETLAVGNLGQRIEHGFASHVVQIPLQGRDVLAGRLQLGFQLPVGFLHAARLGEKARRQRFHVVARQLAFQIAACRLQGA